MNKNDLTELLTLEEVAKKLKVSKATLRRWDNEDKLKAVRIGSRRGVGDRRYRKEDVEKYIENNI
jgi:excisionase family DNA binding protein